MCRQKEATVAEKDSSQLSRIDANESPAQSEKGFMSLEIISSSCSSLISATR